MVYYDKLKWKLLGFRVSDAKDRMYYALLENKYTHKLVRVHFGSKIHENYHDLTGLNAYPHLKHGDDDRRRRYRKRAIGQVKDGFYSPSFFSYYYLW